MINEFNSIEEAELLILSVVSKYIENPTIHRQGKSLVGLAKQISFIIMASPSYELDDMKDELILLKAGGYPVLDVEWQPKFADQMDIMFEIISVTVKVRIFKKK